jgi:hypothetical protein
MWLPRCLTSHRKPGDEVHCTLEQGHAGQHEAWYLNNKCFKVLLFAWGP